MKYFLITLFLLFLSVLLLAQVPNEIKAKRVIATITLRPPIDTVIRLKPSDNGGINYKDGIHYYWDGSRYVPMYNPEKLVQDTFVVSSRGTSGLPLLWINVDGDSLNFKKINGSVDIDVIQNPDSSISVKSTALNASASLDFPNTSTLSYSDITVSVPGAALSDYVVLGVPNSSVVNNTSYTAWVSSNSVVTIRLMNQSGSTVNPAVGTFKLKILK